MKIKSVAVLFFMLLLMGCTQSPAKVTPPPAAEGASLSPGSSGDNKPVSPVPETGEISLITGGESTPVFPGYNYLIKGEHSFEVQVSKNVTKVEYIFHPEASEETYIILYTGVFVAEGMYTIFCPDHDSGTGYFILYNLADGNSIALRTGKFSVSKAN